MYVKYNFLLTKLIHINIFIVIIIIFYLLINNFIIYLKYMNTVKNV